MTISSSLSTFHPSCPVCSNHNIFMVRPYRTNNNIFNSSIFSCNSCTMVFAFPPPSVSELNLFNSSYFSNAHSGLIVDKNTIFFHKGIARCRISYIQNYMDIFDLSLTSVYEVGPGQGFLASLMLQSNPTLDYWVTESDLSCHVPLRNLGVNITDKPRTNSSSLVILSHVLEHVSEPIVFLMDKLSALSPGGVLFIEVPCLDYLHKPLDEPHLLFFQKSSLLILLESLGLIDVKLSYFGRTIVDLKKKFSFKNSLNRCRSRLLRLGCLGQFLANADTSTLIDPFELASTLPYQPYVENDHPSWWLRALARKPS